MATVVEAREVPDTIRSLSPMNPPDYVDLFTAKAANAKDHSPAEWLHAVAESAHPAGRFLAWQVVLGLRLDRRPSPDRAGGWTIAGRGDNWIRLEARSWFLTANLVCRVDDERVSVATFVKYDRPIAMRIWPLVSVVHRRALPRMLGHAVRTLGAA